MHFSVRRIDVVARRHIIIRKVLILTIGIAGYFDSKFVLSNSTIIATIGIRFL